MLLKHGGKKKRLVSVTRYPGQARGSEFSSEAQRVSPHGYGSMASAASSAQRLRNHWHRGQESPREAEPTIIRCPAGASSRGRAAYMGRGAEREKQTAKSVVFEGSGDVNTYTRRTTAKERLATASFAANCAEWRDVGTTRDCSTAWQLDGRTPENYPVKYQSFEGPFGGGREK